MVIHRAYLRRRSSRTTNFRRTESARPGIGRKCEGQVERSRLGRGDPDPPVDIGVLLADAEAGEDTAQQIVGTEGAGDFA